jgi:hypothetical protein
MRGMKQKNYAKLSKRRAENKKVSKSSSAKDKDKQALQIALLGSFLQKRKKKQKNKWKRLGCSCGKKI